jgi:hypothetical protein
MASAATNSAEYSSVRTPFYFLLRPGAALRGRIFLWARNPPPDCMYKMANERGGKSCTLESVYTRCGGHGGIGVRSHASLCAVARTENFAYHRDALHLPVLFRKLRRHHPHPRRSAQETSRPQVVHVEGDPDHPINRGTLCPKGSSLQQDIVNDRPPLKPQVRRPGSDHWEISRGIPPISKSPRASRRPAMKPRHHRRPGPYRQPLRGHRLERRLHRYQ